MINVISFSMADSTVTRLLHENHHAGKSPEGPDVRQPELAHRDEQRENNKINNKTGISITRRTDYIYTHDLESNKREGNAKGRGGGSRRAWEPNGRTRDTRSSGHNINNLRYNTGGDDALSELPARIRLRKKEGEGWEI